MLSISCSDEKPHRTRRLGALSQGQCGSVGLALVFMAFVLLVSLPLATGLMHRLQELALLRKTTQTIDQVLPSVHHCLDEEALSEGQLVLDPIQTRNWLEKRLFANSAPAIQERMHLGEVRVQTLPVDPHVVGEFPADPYRRWPVVSCHVLWQQEGNTPLEMVRSVAVVLDGKNFDR